MSKRSLPIIYEIDFTIERSATSAKARDSDVRCAFSMVRELRDARLS
jgi:hypothetical protein